MPKNRSLQSEVLDQVLHALLGFFLTVVPLLGAFFGVIAREYYQTKQKMLDVAREHGREGSVTFKWVIEYMWTNGDFLKRDLVFSYIGIAVGVLVIVVVVLLW